MNYIKLLKDAINNAMAFVEVLDAPKELTNYLTVIKDTVDDEDLEVIFDNAQKLSVVSSDVAQLAFSLKPKKEEECEIITKLNTEVGYILHYIQDVILLEMCI